MKRLVTMLLAVLIIFSSMPLAVLADNEDSAAAETTAFSTAYPNTWTNTGNMAADIVGVALTQVGYEETSDNHTKYNYWFYNNSDISMSWCGIFISWCADQAGIPTSILKKSGLASGYTVSNMQSNPYGAPAYSFSSTTAQPGDIAFVASSGGSSSSHVALVVGSDSQYVYTVEGNASDTVGERKYSATTGVMPYTSSRILFYARPNYEDNSSPDVDPEPDPEPSPDPEPDTDSCNGNHTWSDWTVSTGSTADSYGTMLRSCTVCKKTETQALAYMNPFTDTGDINGYYYLPILWAYAQDPQITNGTSAETFSPEDSCTRAQVVTFLWRAAGCPAHQNSECPFTDVSASEYYYDAVLWAVEQGITNGTSATTFTPDKTVTRKEFVTFLWRYEGKPAYSSTAAVFSDVTDRTQYFYAPVIWASENGITKGTSDTEFSPDDECIRGQVVTFLYRSFAE